MLQKELSKKFGIGIIVYFTDLVNLDTHLVNLDTYLVNLDTYLFNLDTYLLI